MKRILILGLILGLLLTGCWSVPPPEPEPEPDGIAYRGFFVGVGDYIFFDNMDLNSPAPNTERLNQLFSQCRFGEGETEFTIIETLTNHSATKENILDGILSIFAEADEDDVSYFYYMGHGGVKNGIPIITGSDSKFTLDTSITVHELEERLSMIPGTKIVFLETCHAGNFIDKNSNNFNDMVIDVFAQKTINLINKEGYQILTSSKGSQYTWEWGNWSYFCRGLLDGCEELRGDTDGDSIVDLSELHEHIRIWVMNHRCPDIQSVQIYPEGSTFPIVEY